MSSPLRPLLMLSVGVRRENTPAAARLGRETLHLQLQPRATATSRSGLGLASPSQHMVENDRATQAVSHQSPAAPGQRSRARRTTRLQVRVVVVETVDMPAAPFRTAVAAAVELSHRDAARKQSPSHVAIEPTNGAKSHER